MLTFTVPVPRSDGASRLHAAAVSAVEGVRLDLMALANARLSHRQRVESAQQIVVRARESLRGMAQKLAGERRSFAHDAVTEAEVAEIESGVRDALSMASRVDGGDLIGWAYGQMSYGDQIARNAAAASASEPTHRYGERGLADALEQGVPRPHANPPAASVDTGALRGEAALAAILGGQRR